MKNEMILKTVNLYAFDGDLNTNVTTDGAIAPEIKEYYSKQLIRLAKPKLVYSQFGQVRTIPAGGGKSIEYRKFGSLPAITTPLVEGVTPDGQKLSVTKITDTPKQYGGFVSVSDQLKTTAIDNIVAEATEMIAGQAGKTIDGVRREVVVGGTNVMYAGSKAARSSIAASDVLTVSDIFDAVAYLKSMDAEKIDGYYVGIIHPKIARDLMKDPDWRKPHEYMDTKNLYSGEVGEIAGVRFVETSEAKVFKGAGASGADVYATMIIGKNAYGVTEIEGLGLQHFVKQLGSAGTADPIDQRATIGFKAMVSAVRLVEEYMIRIESGASLNKGIPS